MRKHEVSYHEYNDIISFKSGFCTHIKTSGFSFSTQSKSSKKKSVASVNEFKSTRILQRNDMFNEHQTRFNEHKRKFNESWRNELKRIQTSKSKIKTKELTCKKIKDEFYENWKNYHQKKKKSLTNDENKVIDIFFIAVASFETLFRQKNVQIFAIFMKNLNIQLKKSNEKTLTDSKKNNVERISRFSRCVLKKQSEWIIIS